LISDPKALRYIHLTASANFVKAPERRVANEFLMGPSVLVAEGRLMWHHVYLSNSLYIRLGADHKRHRKILAPAFASTETKSYIPIFHQTAQKVKLIDILHFIGITYGLVQLCNKWKDIIKERGKGQVTIEVSRWLSRATLDAIGQGGI
jgi:hypothetical protein